MKDRWVKDRWIEDHWVKDRWVNKMTTQTGLVLIYLVEFDKKRKTQR